MGEIDSEKIDLMYTSKKKLCILSIFILLYAEFLLPSSHIVYAKAIPDEYKAHNIMGFVDYLIEHNDYYRALVELKRYNAYYTHANQMTAVGFTETFLLFKNNNFRDLTIRDQSFNIPDSVFISDMYIVTGQYQKVFSVFNFENRTHVSRELLSIYKKRELAASILLHQHQDIDAVYNDIFDATTLRRYEALQKQSEYLFASRKSTSLAFISGIIPGMGYVYSGNTPTGLISLALISCMSGITYAAWKTDMKPLAILTGTATCFFYGGSIIGGFYEARKFNRNLHEKVKNSIYTEMDYDNDYTLLYNHYGLGREHEPRK